MTALPQLPCHEVGSLAKPSFRVKMMTGQKITQEDLDEVNYWGKKLEIAEKDALLEVLTLGEPIKEELKAAVMDYSSLFAVRLLEKAGLDLVFDGEMQRVEMYEYPLKCVEGFVFKGHVRSFDRKFYKKACCEKKPKLIFPYHRDEFAKVRKLAVKPVKVPLTGAYTLMDWSFNDCYQTRQEFAFALAKEVLKPNIDSLIAQGAKFIQIDEPAASTKKAESKLFVDTMLEALKDVPDDVFISLHICFSEYERLFSDLKRLTGVVDEVHLEYANRDSRKLGTSKDVRSGYTLLEHFKDNTFKVGLGVIDVHTDEIEPKELIRDRILYAVDQLNNPERFMISPDCGLRTRSWGVAYEKLCHMVEGRQLALDAL